MKLPNRKSHQVFKIINSSLIDLPSPSNISFLWNMGFLLTMCLLVQMITGILLAMHFTPNTTMAFISISHIMRDVNYGWLIRTFHSNGASLMFFCLYTHMSRGIYFKSYFLQETWNIGLIMLILSMATAFLGYVLPWGQMSFWGATVITNLISALPYSGPMIVEWLWGGFSVNNATLTRFFALHYSIPFIIIFFIMMHLMFLHQTGSSNPLGSPSNQDKIHFHPFFTTKDILSTLIMMTLFSLWILQYPFLLIDPENFMEANPLSTPIHIQPEWYFLFAYAILRCIPNKLGGVLGLLLAIFIFFFFSMKHHSSSPTVFNPILKMMFWSLCSVFFLLTWLGSKPVEAPFLIMSQISSIMYFIVIFTLLLL